MLTDTSWLCLKGKEQEYEPMEGDEEDAMLKRQKETLKLEYTGALNLISLEMNILLSYLFSLDGSSNTNDILTGGVSPFHNCSITVSMKVRWLNRLSSASYPQSYYLKLRTI